MSALHVRNVPESLFAAIRERAERNGRSVQQEVLRILEAAAGEDHASHAPEPIRLIRVKTTGQSFWRREEIYGDEGR